MKNKFLLLSAALLLACTPMFAGSVSVVTKRAVVVIDSKQTAAVTLQQVQCYMWFNYGIQIVNITPIDGSEDVLATDINGKDFRVFVLDSSIKGMQEVDY